MQETATQPRFRSPSRFAHWEVSTGLNPAVDFVTSRDLSHWNDGYRVKGTTVENILPACVCTGLQGSPSHTC